MKEIKYQYPVTDEQGNEDLGLIKTWAEDENGVVYKVKQIETGIVYDEPVDFAMRYIDADGVMRYKPKYYSYEATNEVSRSEETEEPKVE